MVITKGFNNENLLKYSEKSCQCFSHKLLGKTLSRK